MFSNNQLERHEIITLLKANGIVAKVGLNSFKTGFEIRCKTNEGFLKAELFDKFINVSRSYGFYK